MLLIKPQHGSVNLQLSTRSILMKQGDEVQITHQEFQELDILIKSLSLVCLTDQEAEERRIVRAQISAAQSKSEEPFSDPEVVEDVSSMDVPKSLEMPTDVIVEDIVVDAEEETRELPEPISCPYTRDGLMGLVKSEIWEIMDTLELKDKVGTKKVLVERIIDYYRG